MEITAHGKAYAATTEAAALEVPARSVDPALIRLAGPPAEGAPAPPPLVQDKAKRTLEQQAKAAKATKAAIRVQAGRTKLLQTRRTIARTLIANPRYLEVIQFSPHELAIIGKQPGKTRITIGFQGTDRELPETFEVTVHGDDAGS